VVNRKKSSGLDGPVYDDLVDEALCFGWIDSQARRVDADRMMQWFSPRRPGGLWSALNKERIERLVRDGLMTEAGQSAIDEAKADGSWSQTDELDSLIVPPDLKDALDAAPQAKAAYESLADSAKKQYLWWTKRRSRSPTPQTPRRPPWGKDQLQSGASLAVRLPPRARRQLSRLSRLSSTRPHRPPRRGRPARPSTRNGLATQARRRNRHRRTPARPLRRGTASAGQRSDALGLIGDPASRQALTESASDPHKDVRAAATAALCRLQ